MAADLQLHLLLVLLLLAIPLVFLATRRRTSRAPRAGRRLPPGPRALPVIGHLHHLAGAPPHRALRDLARRHGPLMMLRFGELDVAVASSPDAAREIMKTHDPAFASRPQGPMLELVHQGSDGVIFAPYGDGWRQLRKICAVELFSARRVQSFRPVRLDELGRLLRAVEAAAASASPVNLTERMSAYVADSAVRAIIGSRFEHREAFLRMLRGAIRIMTGMTLPELFPSSRLASLVSRAPSRIARIRWEMRQLIDTIVKEHQESGASGDDGEEEDLLGVLLRLQKEVGSQYPLSTENIKTVMVDVFAAGSDSSATTLDWAMAELMKNPRVLEKAQGEVRRALADHGKVTEDNLTNLHYLQLVIKETLRLHPPATLLLPRKCRTACQVLGFDIPEGTMVIVNAWAISRDPELWDKPEEFMPERFEHNGRDFKGANFEFIPFGAGRRMCPGMAFGLAHIELTLTALLFHFDWKLPGGMAAEDFDMAEAFGVTTQREADLVVVPVPFVPVPKE